MKNEKKKQRQSYIWTLAEALYSHVRQNNIYRDQQVTYQTLSDKGCHMSIYLYVQWRGKFVFMNNADGVQIHYFPLFTLR